jgi:hypothetical protein
MDFWSVSEPKQSLKKAHRKLEEKKKKKKATSGTDSRRDEADATM